MDKAVRCRESNKECWVKRRGKLWATQDSCYSASDRRLNRMWFLNKSQKSRFGEFLKYGIKQILMLATQSNFKNYFSGISSDSREKH